MYLLIQKCSAATKYLCENEIMPIFSKKMTCFKTMFVTHHALKVGQVTSVSMKLVMP